MDDSTIQAVASVIRWICIPCGAITLIVALVYIMRYRRKQNRLKVVKKDENQIQEVINLLDRWKNYP